MTPAELMAKLETYYDFQCEGGPLRLCVAWQQLKAQVLAALSAAGQSPEECPPVPESAPDMWTVSRLREIVKEMERFTAEDARQYPGGIIRAKVTLWADALAALPASPETQP